jgi:hypothetical protein
MNPPKRMLDNSVEHLSIERFQKLTSVNETFALRPCHDANTIMLSMAVWEAIVRAKSTSLCTLGDTLGIGGVLACVEMFSVQP